MSQKENKQDFTYLADRVFWGAIFAVWILKNDFRFSELTPKATHYDEWFLTIINFIVIVWPLFFIMWFMKKYINK